MSTSYGSLPGLNIDPNFVTAAGISSGSYFSHYLHTVNSSIIKGSGLLNGSLYSFSFADRITSKMDDPDTQDMITNYVSHATREAENYEIPPG
jgi:hypothetical protein